jgi:hypothetical protein
MRPSTHSTSARNSRSALTTVPPWIRILDIWDSPSGVVFDAVWN